MDRPKVENEVVRRFSDEMYSVLETKLPISRAKMGTITKLAVKNVKYFKHIVMIVEKFISKCSPEYKVPGLYVIDSIVRQSRHQLGTDKDVYGPRFTKKFLKTFRHLFQCSPPDQAKVVRVLNLWQKNGVFTPDVIQPLLSLAPGPVSPSAPPVVPPTTTTSSSTTTTGPRDLDLNSASAIIQQQQQQIQALLQQQQQLQSQAHSLLGPALHGILHQGQPPQLLPHQQADEVAPPPQQTDSLAALLQQAQHLQQLQALQQHLGEDNESGTAPAVMSNVETGGQTVFNQALLDDFDYSDDEDDMEKRLAQQRERMLQQKTRLEDRGGNPGLEGEETNAEGEERVGSEPPSSTNELDLLDQLQEQFQSRMQENTSLALSNARHDFPPRREELRVLDPPPIARRLNPPIPPPSYPPPMPPPMQHILPPPPLPPSHRDNHRPPGPPPPRDWGHPLPPLPPPHFPPPPRSPSPPRMRSRFHSPPHRGHRSPPHRGHHSPPPPHRGHHSPSPPLHARRHWRERDRDRWSPPRRRSRSPPRHHSRDRSRSPRRSSPRRRMSPPPPPLSAAEREKQRKGIPFGQDKHITVCSSTIWMGHLAKSVTQEQVVQAFEDFGQVKSVELIQARGCAYVVMIHRSDAVRALASLRDLRLNGNVCKLSWAPGRGVKGKTFKNYWDLEVGASYIPWEKVRTEEELAEVSEGGWVDPSTCPPGMKLPKPKDDTEETSQPPSTDGKKPQLLPQQQAPPTNPPPNLSLPLPTPQQPHPQRFPVHPSGPPPTAGPPPFTGQPPFSAQPPSFQPQPFAGAPTPNGPHLTYVGPPPHPPTGPPGTGAILNPTGGGLHSFSAPRPPPSSIPPPTFTTAPSGPVYTPLFPPRPVPPQHMLPPHMQMPSQQPLQQIPPQLLPPQHRPPHPTTVLPPHSGPSPSGPSPSFPPVPHPSSGTQPQAVTHLPPPGGPPVGPPPSFPPSSAIPQCPPTLPTSDPTSPPPSLPPPPSADQPPSLHPSSDTTPPPDTTPPLSTPPLATPPPPDSAPDQKKPDVTEPDTISTNDDMQIDNSPPLEDS